jgi:hypothetical protein
MAESYDSTVIEHFKRELKQFQDLYRAEKDTNRALERDYKSMCEVVDDWKKIVREKDELIEAQAAEIRKAKEDYDREMASMDKLMEDHDQQMRNTLVVLDNLKSQLQSEQMSKIDLQREVQYLQQFEPKKYEL